MDANSQYELYLIKRELQNIINELDSISQGIQNDFSGIGNEQCAACVRNVAEKYRYVKRRLNNILHLFGKRCKIERYFCSESVR